MKNYLKSLFVLIFSLCIAAQAQAATISVENNGVPTDADLTEISTSQGARISYESSFDCYVVYVYFPFNSIDTLKAIPHHPKATVTGVGEVHINYGYTFWGIDVRGPSGTTKHYNIAYYVYYHDPKLQDLVVTSSDGEPVTLIPSFSPDVTHYTCTTVPSRITVSGVPSAYGHLNGFGIHSILPGDTTLELTSVAQDGNDSTYFLHIYDARLKELTITPSGGEITLTPSFSPDVYHYTDTVAASYITISGEPHSSGKVQGNGRYTLSFGENHIELTSIAKNDSIKYYFNIHRLSNDAKLTNLDMYLNNTQVILTPPFSPYVTDYTCYTAASGTVDVRFDYRTSNAESVVSGADAQTMSGNTLSVNIAVRAPSGFVGYYTINLVRGTPAGGLDIEAGGSETVRVYNLSGVFVGEYKSDALQALPEGFYVLKSSDKRNNKKIIIKK